MKVLLRSDINGVGRRGDIVDVKSGYFRNFLLPTGAALAANETMEIQAASMRKARDIRDAQSRAAAEAFDAQLSDTTAAAVELQSELDAVRAIDSSLVQPMCADKGPVHDSIAAVARAEG